MHTQSLNTFLLSPLFPKDACDAVMVGEMVRVGGDHSFSPGHICSQFARTFFRSKMMHTGHRTNWTLEDNTCVPVLLYSCTDALFFESVSSNFSSDLFLQIHQQGGGVFSQASFEISQIVLVKFLLRTSYQQRFLKCIFFKRQRFLTLETGQLLLVIEH